MTIIKCLLRGLFDMLGRIKALVDDYHTGRYHQSLSILTPEDVYTGRAKTCSIAADVVCGKFKHPH